MKHLTVAQTIIVGAVGAAISGSLLYGGYNNWELRQQNELLGKQVSYNSQALSLTEEYLEEVKLNLKNITQDNQNLSEALASEQSKNRVFESQIREIAGTVGTLTKLSKTDPELLRKYSKVYFLSENYAPAQLSPISSDYLFDKNKTQLILSATQRFLEAMLSAAKRDGISMQVVSAFRSFAEQASVKYGYKIIYGAGTANQFSADQGYSEHQLGTTVDLTTPELKGVFLSFEKTDAYKWLTANAHRFGFILSYPKGNAYYQFEPWHWRFVGVALAGKLQSEGKNFYELTQREINDYLINIFD